MPYTSSKHSLVYVKNIDKKDLEVRWDGVQQAVLKPNEVLPFPSDLAEHAINTLISRLLIRAGKKTNNEKFIAALREKIVVTSQDLPQRKNLSEAEQLAEDVSRLHKKARKQVEPVIEDDDDDDDDNEVLPTKKLGSVAKDHATLKRRNRVEEVDEDDEDEDEEEMETAAADEEIVDNTDPEEDAVEDDSEEMALEPAEEVEEYETTEAPADDEVADPVDAEQAVEDVKEEMKQVSKLPTRQAVMDYASQNGINVEDTKMFNYLESLGIRDLITEVDYPLDTDE